MMQNVYKWLLYDVMGWTENVTETHPEKYIICLAPHTSNWDFIIGQLYMRAKGFHSNFLMKKEWFVGPLGNIFRKMGGIPVHRSKKCKMTDQLVRIAQNTKEFCLTITPEGTRSLNTEWKRGFYFIALGASIPILLYGIDYKNKKIVCTKTFNPTGDIDKEIHEIKEYYKDFTGKHPEKFSI